MSCGRKFPPIPNGIGAIHQVTVDLDGTIAQGKWPIRRVIGEPISEGVALLKHFAELGYSICVYTSRPYVDEPLIWEWILKHDLPVEKVRCDKPAACLYLDDRAMNPWGEIGYVPQSSELAWAAGFFDGEGSTSALRSGGPEKRRYRLAIQISQSRSTEVLERFRSAVQIGEVGGPYKDPLGKRVVYRFSAYGLDGLIVLEKLQPLVSSVKQEQMKLAAWRVLEQPATNNGPRNHNDYLDRLKEFVEGKKK